MHKKSGVCGGHLPYISKIILALRLVKRKQFLKKEGKLGLGACLPTYESSIVCLLQGYGGSVEYGYQ